MNWGRNWKHPCRMEQAYWIALPSFPIIQHALKEGSLWLFQRILPHRRKRKSSSRKLQRSTNKLGSFAMKLRKVGFTRSLFQHRMAGCCQSVPLFKWQHQSAIPSSHTHHTIPYFMISTKCGMCYLIARWAEQVASSLLLHLQFLIACIKWSNIGGREGLGTSILTR